MGRSRAVRVLLATCALAPAAGCSSGAAGAASASTHAGDSGSAYVGDSGSVPPDDPGGSPDSGPDGGTPCAAEHSFCADFEQGTVDASFGLAEFAGNGMFASSLDHPHTGARSLHVLIPSIDPDNEGLAALVQQVSGAPSTLTMAVDVWVDVASDTCDAIKLGNDGGLVVVRLAKSAGGATAALVEPLADGTERTIALPGTLALGAWSHFELALALNSGGGTATVHVNGAVAVDQAAMTELRTGMNPFWWIGVDVEAGATPVAPWSVFFDDVTVDAT